MMVCVECKEIIVGEFHETPLGAIHSGGCPAIMTTHKDLEPFGLRTTVARSVLQLSDKQMDGIQRLAKAIYSLDGELNADNISNMWATDEDEIKNYGARPAVKIIEDYLRTTAFIQDMARRGVRLDEMAQQLTTEQIAFVQMMRNPEGRKLAIIMKRAGVTKAKFDGWMKQPLFSKYFQKTIGDDSETALMLSEITLAQKAQEGDMGALKFLWEYKDKYNAAKNTNANDAMEFVRIVLGAVSRNVKDPDTIKAIKDEIEAYQLTQGVR